MKKLWIGILVVFTMMINGCSSTKDISEAPASDTVVITVIDVDQGSAAIIQSGEESILIDAGENDQGDKVVDTCEELGITTIDYAIGTHPHSDHIGGMDTVINEVQVENLYIPNKIHTSKTFEDVLDAVEKNDVNLLSPKVGEQINFKNGASLTFLAPDETKDYGDNNLNAWSIVSKFQFGDISYLSGGDCDSEELTDLLASNQDLSSTIFQAFHHGSSNQTNTEELLAAINPRLVLMSVGEGNSYGHPHQEFLSMIKAHQWESYRTDKNGTITITIKDDNYSIDTKKTEKENDTEQSQEHVGQVIGNKNSKKYHLEDCNNLPLEKNRIYFESATEAEAEGYSASKDCIH